MSERYSHMLEVDSCSEKFSSWKTSSQHLEQTSTLAHSFLIIPYLWRLKCTQPPLRIAFSSDSYWTIQRMPNKIGVYQTELIRVLCSNCKSVGMSVSRFKPSFYFNSPNMFWLSSKFPFLLKLWAAWANFRSRLLLYQHSTSNIMNHW